MTTAQWTAVDKMAERFHVVLVDPAQPVGAVKLTPASFCDICGGDGVDPDSYQLPECEPCPPCGGRGGIAVTHTPEIVMPDGEVR